MSRKKIIWIVVFSLFALIAGTYFYAKQFVNLAWEKSEIDLTKINLPPGFKIAIFAENVKNARSITLSPNGTIFVGTRSEGSIYALRDEDGDYKAEKKWVIATDLNIPNGVAVKDDDLYVAEYNRILRFEDIEKQLANPPSPIVISESYPSKKHHGWKFIDFGPDGKLYVPVGAPCNICESEDIFNTITRINPDGSGFEIVHRGIRNTVGFTWHPNTKELWFTDNGRDLMGNDIPNCELNHAPKDGMHFGYPYCHQGDIADPEFGEKHSCSEFTPPVVKLGPHVAPLGLIFYTGNQFPKNYKNQLLIAEHGSWNRAEPIGYQVSLVRFDADGKVEGKSAFASGWLQDGTAWGRPVDLEQLPDGSILVSDDFADVIYRIYYEK